VGFESIELFLLTAEASKTKLLVQPQECLHKLHQIISYNLDFERFIIRFSDFDLSHVNEALIQHKSKPVHGSLSGRIEEKRLWIMQIIFCIYSKTLLFKDLNFINKKVLPH
jgi:hypothetical protein